MKNIYKVSLISGALFATALVGASYSGNIVNNLSTNTNPVLEKQDNDKEVADDNVKQSSTDTDKETADDNVNDETGIETQDDNITLPANAISESKAKEIVAKSYSGSEIVGIETENEDSKVVYNISLKDGIDVKVDVSNGNIVKTDKRGQEGEKDDGKDNDTETNDD